MDTRAILRSLDVSTQIMGECQRAVGRYVYEQAVHLEADVADAVALQDYDKLERIVIIVQSPFADRPGRPAVASRLG